MDNGIFAGIDVGSLSSEALLLDEGGGILGYAIAATGSNPVEAARRCMAQVLARADLDESRVGMVVATGYGRIRIPFAGHEITEITCHAKGARYLFPGTRTVVDIGGQDSKVITLDEAGRVTDFAMNDKCAAGTGRFLEVMAAALETELGEMGRRSLQAGKGVPISSMCTVFAESEVISLIAEGRRPEEIIRGLHESISRRVFGMSRRLKVRPEITFTGGVAKNQGIVETLKELFRMPVNVPEEPQMVGALGAAICARDMVRSGKAKDKRGVRS